MVYLVDLDNYYIINVANVLSGDKDKAFIQIKKSGKQEYNYNFRLDFIDDIVEGGARRNGILKRSFRKTSPSMQVGYPNTSR